MTTIFAGTALTPEGWRENVRVEIDAPGRIASVEPDVRVGEGDEQVAILLPALANLHSHTFQRAMAGLSEARGPLGRDSFWTWREIMYRFLDVLDPDDVEAIAAFAFMEMLEAGFSAVAEFHYLHHRPGGVPYDDIGELSARIAAAAETTGIGLTLLPVYYRHGGVDGRPLAGGQLRFGCAPDEFAKLLERAEKAVAALPDDAGLGVAPHSLRAAGAEDLAWLAGLMPERSIHMHLAEQHAEVEEMLAARGARPVIWLLDNVRIDERWCLVHCTQMNEDETRRLAASGAVAGLCPVTEASLGDGIFDGARFLDAGGRFGIGTDSNICVSVVEELRQLEYAQRLRDRGRAVLADESRSTGRRLYDIALAGGAQALGRAAGVIAPGRLADLVAIDPDPMPHSPPGDRILDGWTFAGSNGWVREVWSAGRHMVKGGRHLAREAVADGYRERLLRIMDRL